MRTAVTALFAVCTFNTANANFFDDIIGKVSQVVQNEAQQIFDDEVNKGKDSLINVAKDVVMG